MSKLVASARKGIKLSQTGVQQYIARRTKTDLTMSGLIKRHHEKVISIDNRNAVKHAAALLNSGSVIALPTDTVYGLACSANNPEAIQKLYDIKGRHELKPVAICVPEVDHLRRWGTVKIGIRIPAFKFIRDVSRSFTLPIALTSANKSASKSTLNVHEFECLWPSLGAVFDGGQLGLSEQQRAASTVIDLSEDGTYSIIRSGVAAEHTIRTVEKYNFFPKHL
uniref:Threonylcarbamoyl-AMP synthase n=1 Tax=Anopheles atroparvus TaxID=41427 RepID=A0AAG5DL00_ANOAO